MTQIDSFCRRIIDSAEKRPDRIAMTVIGEEDNNTFTFSEMLRAIRSLAFRLEQEKISVGDRVALIGENSPQWAIAYLGILFSGAVVVPLDPHGEVDLLSRFIQNSKAKLAFLSEEASDKFGKICEHLGQNIPAVLLQEVNKITNFQSFKDWITTEFPTDFAKQTPPAETDDIALLMYTSGTTGQPKAVPLTHGNILAEIEGVQDVIHLEDNEVILSLLPLFHAYSQIVNLWLATTYGAKVIYLKELTPDEIQRGMKGGKISVLTGVPRLWYLFHKKIFDGVAAQSGSVQFIFNKLLNLNGLLRDKLNVNLGKTFFKKVHDGFGGNLRLAVSAGSRFDEKVAQDYHKLGFTVLQAYGLTETSGAATVTRPENNKVGSVGQAMKNSEIKIDAPDSEGVGEVLIRGEMVMKGYLNNPEANQLAFTEDGWFRSGDLGKFDEQKNLYIVGRKKEIIILPSGKNVYPEDVEAHYAKSPVVGEICVLGVKDKSAEHAGAEKLFAVVVPDFEYMKQNNINNSLDMVRWTFDDLSREIPEYQRIKDYIVRAESLPRTPTRKIQRFQLLKQLEQSGELEKSRTETKTWNFTAEDKDLMATNVAQILSQAVKNHNAEIAEIHPKMNIELDLGLDSLARAECIAVLEQNLNIEFEAEQVATALTFGETVKLAQKLAPHAEMETSLVTQDFNWRRIVTETKDDMPEVKAVLRDNFLWFTAALLVMRLLYLIARIFFRLDLKGLENLTKIEKPFIVCPNHQSYLDAFFVCAVYPRSILKDTFHVGAKMFFEGSLSQYFPKLLKIVPIDPDVQLLKAMKAGAIGLRNGKILNIYPEGERAYDGNLHPFKKGAAILATELNVPIVPVAIDGFYKVWARNSNKINFAQIKIHFGEPLDWKTMIDKELEAEAKYDAVTEALKQKIQTMLDEMRK